MIVGDIFYKNEYHISMLQTRQIELPKITEVSVTASYNCDKEAFTNSHKSLRFRHISEVLYAKFKFHLNFALHSFRISLHVKRMFEQYATLTLD